MPLSSLLQDSLGGNCRTTIISTVSPSGDAFEETVSTLKFADRASNIGNNPIINVARWGGTAATPLITHIPFQPNLPERCTPTSHQPFV